MSSYTLKFSIKSPLTRYPRSCWIFYAGAKKLRRPSLTGYGLLYAERFSFIRFLASFRRIAEPFLCGSDFYRQIVLIRREIARFVVFTAQGFDGVFEFLELDEADGFVFDFFVQVSKRAFVAVGRQIPCRQGNVVRGYKFLQQNIVHFVRFFFHARQNFNHIPLRLTFRVQRQRLRLHFVGVQAENIRNVASYVFGKPALNQHFEIRAERFFIVTDEIDDVQRRFRVFLFEQGK